MKFFILDLDGSLCNDHHRSHFSSTENWPEYHKLSVHDEPNEVVLTLVRKLTNDNAVAVVITGRTYDFESVTNEWLHSLGVYPEYMFMRRLGDDRSSVALKRESLESFLEVTQTRVEECIVAIEDKSSIVDLWRSLGIPVLQVHQRT